MQLLLIIHILAGTVALMSAALAVSSAKGKKFHVLSGRTYFWSMVTIFLTAIPMSVTSNNVFLFLIAIFSFYLAFAGMRFARNRNGAPSIIDWLAIGLMVFSGICMWLLAAIYFVNKNPQYITLMIFGLIAVILGYTDFRSYKNKTATGKQRISRHLTNMMGGTIAVITAFLVTNVNIEPIWIWWIFPTITIVPVIVWWNHRVLNN